MVTFAFAPFLVALCEHLLACLLYTSEYTYEGPWITHVGIYVGDGWMIHAGDPIGYIKFMDSYYSCLLYTSRCV